MAAGFAGGGGDDDGYTRCFCEQPCEPRTQRDTGSVFFACQTCKFFRYETANANRPCDCGRPATRREVKNGGPNQVRVWLCACAPVRLCADISACVRACVRACLRACVPTCLLACYTALYCTALHCTALHCTAAKAAFG